MSVNVQCFYKDKLKKQADIICFVQLIRDVDINPITNVKHTLNSDTIQGHDGCNDILTGPP